MGTFFTAWDYPVTYLEFAAVVVSLTAIVLAAQGRRSAWPFYFLSGVLYGWLFIEFGLLGSAILQLVFIAAAVWGWFGWGAGGVSEPKRLPVRVSVIGLVGVVVIWLIVTPLLSAVGAAATLLDGFVLVGSIAAQLLMVKGYVEAWPMWTIVNVVGTYHYANQQLYFTSLFYFVLLCLAVWGWWSWLRKGTGVDVHTDEETVATSGRAQ